MDSFNFQQVMALKEMIVGEQEEEEFETNFQKGSVLNPGDIGSKDKKDGVAKPFSKIEIKKGERPPEDEPQPKQKKAHQQ